MIRYLSFACAICVTAVATAAAQSSSPDSVAVLESHERWFRGLLSHDTTTLSSMLTPDVTLAFANGAVMPRRSLLQALQSGQLVYDSASHEERHIRVYGTTAIVTGRSVLELRFRNAAQSEHITYTATYMRTGTVWRMAAWQSTLIPAPKPAP